MEFIEPEWDGQNRIALPGVTKPLPQRAALSRQAMNRVTELAELFSVVREGRARLGPVLPNHTREIIFRGQPTGRYVSLEVANRIRGRKDEAPVIDPFDSAKPMGSAHPDGQSIPVMVDSVEMPKCE